jgi:bifunctional DNA-binding transcriptional regulator/antitoxin component of YhaV-PrlF toxin-antitoxin module
MMRWCRERGLEPGDTIVFERTGERVFMLRLEKAEAGPAA